MSEVSLKAESAVFLSGLNLNLNFRLFPSRGASHDVIACTAPDEPFYNLEL